MNIRIGNDVKIKMPITDIGDITISNILNTQCVFKLSKQLTPNPLFHQSTSYTIHGYGNLSYNVNPYKGVTDYTDLHSRGFVDCKSNEYISNCTISDGYIYASFPAECLHIIGSYDCIFNIKVNEDGWNNDNVHTYRSTYYELFTLVDDISGEIGSITINAVNKDTNEIYVFTLTDSEFIALNGNYSLILPTADKFSLALIGVSGRSVTITGTGKRICFISNRGDLKMSYNSFTIPMSMYKLSNGSYLYLSDYTYSNITISISVINTGITNTICTEYDINTDPEKDPDSGGSSSETDPVIINKNILSGTTLKLYGSVILSVISIKGTCSNNTIAL